MDTTSTSNINYQSPSMNNKNMIIGVLIFLLILSFLGINLLMIFGDFFQSLVNLFGPLVNNFLALLGLTTGTVINKTSDAVRDTTKVGIDLAGGAVHDVGDLLINASNNIPTKPLDIAINKSPIITSQPKYDDAKNPIQKPITANKTKWCLVGEYEGRRGCIEIGEQDKCLSGQVFPEQKMCLNPNLTQNSA
jgi:hypothetical protein